MPFSPPCTLRRQDCLVGAALAQRLMLPSLEPSSEASSVELDNGTHHENTDMTSSTGELTTQPSPPALEPSRFIQLFTTCPPAFEALLCHLSTQSLLRLYQTSSTLRVFLQNYPLAWTTLSFRATPPPQQQQQTPHGGESPRTVGGPRKPHAMDLLLWVLQPYSNRLTRLDLDNTSVSGAELHARVLIPRRATLQHLSVRGCKDVSLKYHILPFLDMQVNAPIDLYHQEPLALRSLYAYRCRHHRRRPYLPGSLLRRDSDSQPTHQLIELCHQLGIWTDTAWCPTPGVRCQRRKDYYIGRSATGPFEVWVPYDRLFRSMNFAGSAVDGDTHKPKLGSMAASTARPVRLWEQDESHAGEPLGMDDLAQGEGKNLPMHLRQSHRIFVESFKCTDCGETIVERCEQCSVRMHCVGCRKTLCASCAFDRPLPRKRRRLASNAVDEDATALFGTHNLPASILAGQARARRRSMRKRSDLFWWAPGAIRSPNLMTHAAAEDVSSGDESLDEPHPLDNHGNTPRLVFPQLELEWCCQRPSFTGGGAMTFNGPLSGDAVRAAPLPQGKGFEDLDFVDRDGLLRPDEKIEAGMMTPRSADQRLTTGDQMHLLDVHFRSTRETQEDYDITPLLESDEDPSIALYNRQLAPRSLCLSCYRSRQWEIPCAACRLPICKLHDIKTLRARRCGFVDLQTQRSIVQTAKRHGITNATMLRRPDDANKAIFLKKWKGIVSTMKSEDVERRLRGQWTPVDRGVEAHTTGMAFNATMPYAADNEGALPQHLLTGPHTQTPSPLDAQQTGAHTPLSRAQARPRSRSFSTAASLNQEGPRMPGISRIRVQRPVFAQPQVPPWLGCGAFFCPSPRNYGDTRPRCYNPVGEGTVPTLLLQSTMNFLAHISVNNNTNGAAELPANNAVGHEGSEATDEVHEAGAGGAPHAGHGPIMGTLPSNGPPAIPSKPNYLRRCENCAVHVCAQCDEDAGMTFVEAATKLRRAKRAQAQQNGSDSEFLETDSDESSEFMHEPLTWRGLAATGQRTRPWPAHDATIARGAQYCPCSWCTSVGFLCPNCAVAPETVRWCRRLEEDAARATWEQRERQREAERIESERQKWEETAEERNWADELAEGVGELFVGLEAPQEPQEM